MATLTRGAVPFGRTRPERGHWPPHGETVYLTLELRPAQGIGREGAQTVTHGPIPPDALEVSITGEAYPAMADGSRDRRYNGTAYGQIVDTLRAVPGERAARMVALWDRWHLNGMRGGCAHQGESWTCTFDRNAETRETVRRIGGDPDSIPADICGTVNGWPAIRERFGEHPYSQRGDRCYTCGRNRWDEPSDACPETGYRYGTSWLYEPVPADVLAELRRLFGKPEGDIIAGVRDYLESTQDGAVSE